MKTLDEALATIVQVRTHTSEEATIAWIAQQGPKLIETELKYDALRLELRNHLLVQEFLFALFRSYNSGTDSCPMLHMAFYFGVRVGMEMEKQENPEGFLPPDMGELP